MMRWESAGYGNLIWMLLAAAIILIPFWRICRKAGYSGWLSLLILFPFLNLGLLYFLAFARWPNAGQTGSE